MARAGTPVSPRGLALLAVAGAVGVALAVHGWSAHEHSGLPGSLAASAGASATPGATASSTAGTTPRTGAASAPPASSSASPGPLLRSQPFAQYAFRVWPGVPSAAAKTAMTGLSISVRKQRNGVLVTAGVVGQAAPQPRLYPGGADVYVVEAALGDDSNNADYNLGDDGLVVTSAAGRILR